MLKRRDAVQMDYEMFVDDLRKKEEELDAVNVLWFGFCCLVRKCDFS